MKTQALEIITKVFRRHSEGITKHESKRNVKDIYYAEPSYCSTKGQGIAKHERSGNVNRDITPLPLGKAEMWKGQLVGVGLGCWLGEGGYP